MRWIKLIAILSLGLFFFGVLIVLHLCISLLRLPNRWKIVSRSIRGFTWSMVRILNVKITVEGDAGQLETRRLCHHQQPFWLSRWDCSRKPFPGHFCFKTGSEKLAGAWSVDDTLRHRFYQSAKQGPDSAGG